MDEWRELRWRVGGPSGCLTRSGGLGPGWPSRNAGCPWKAYAYLARTDRKNDSSIAAGFRDRRRLPSRSAAVSA